MRALRLQPRRHCSAKSIAVRQYATRTPQLADALSRGAPIDIHPEVEDALRHARPVVALETTIITHGMPYPVNLSTATAVERIVRDAGAVPATIGMISGRVKIGLKQAELEHLADVQKNPSVVKLSRRDIGPAIALKRDGGTTCSSTLIFAALAGIKVFATGGLGGVHRGGETSMDVSADLQELTRCPVGLVSAGVKSILDIGRTLEYLETLGVPVLSYADTYDFPAFYSRRSGFKSPWRLNDPKTAAQVLHTHWQMGMTNGALFGVPIPEEYEAVGEELQASVEQALQEAEQLGINKRGKEVTPWLLKRVGELTSGKSLDSNVALIKNTASVGANIAVEYAKLNSERLDRAPNDTVVAVPVSSRPINEGNTISDNTTTKGDISLPPAKLVIIGSAAVDITAQSNASTDPSTELHSTVPGAVMLTLGGVGRNVAEAAHRTLALESKDLSTATTLITAVGSDAFGRLLLEETSRMGMRTSEIVSSDTARTAVCNMILDREGGLHTGVADMDIIRSLDKVSILGKIDEHKPSIVCIDANLSPEIVQAVCLHCYEHNITLFFEPTSITKSTVVLPGVARCLPNADVSRSPITFAAPNVLELAQIYREAQATDLTAHEHWWKVIDDMGLGSQFRMELEQLARRSVSEEDASRGTLSFLVDDGVAQMAMNLLPFFQHLIIKCGSRGVVTVFRVSGVDVHKSDWARQITNIRNRSIIARNSSGKTITVLRHFPALTLPNEEIVNVTGAGDTLVGSILGRLVQTPTAFQDPATLEALITQAQQAAVLTLRSQYAVSPMLSDVKGGQRP